MNTMGSGTAYMDGVKIGEAANVYASVSSNTLSELFKSVKLNGEEFIHNPTKGVEYK